MKQTLLALTMLIGLSVGSQVARADVSVDFFYDNLSGGNWIEVGDYGYCWQPDVAVSNADWRPYADGYWAYTDVGWTWVSYEDFGWATYHYGRWARLADQGWVWVPGRDEDLEWGPAWVSWRTGDRYVGWAPLPPTGERIYEGGAITGHVDVEFDIGPAYYNFVDVRYIGEPVLRERIFAPTQNITYINQTVNVTNITYKNKTVYNYGPDINVVNQRASRPIQRLTIQRENNVDFANVGKSGGLKTRVQGQSLVIAAPAHIAKPSRQIAPPSVKTKVAKANLDTGWSGVGDAKAKEQFKQKLRAEDLSKVPRGSASTTGEAAAGSSPAAANAGVQTGASPAASPAVSATEETRVKGGKHDRNRAGEAAAGVTSSPGTTASPSTGVGASSETNAAAERGKHRNRPTDLNATGATSPSPAAPAAASAATGASPADISGQDRGQHRGGRGERNAPGARTDTEVNTPPVRGQGRRFEQTPPAVSPGAASTPDLQGQGRGEGRHQGRRLEQQPAVTTPGVASTPAVQGQGPGEGRHRGDRQGVPEGQPGQGRHEGKPAAPEATPVPTP